jgi:hypothetical protein
MLKAYADDSGSDGSGTPYCLAGFLMGSEHWARFADDWQAALDRPPAIDYFKMAEVHNYTGEFAKSDFYHREIRVRKVHELLEVIESVSPHAIYSAVDWSEFRVSQLPFVKGAPEDPYHCLVPWLLDSVMAWQRRDEIFPTPVDFIFDEQGEALVHAIRTVYPKVKARVGESVARMMGSLPEMKDDKKVLPLQAADMLAWNLRRHYDPKREGDDWEWLYERLKLLCVNGAFSAGSYEGAQIFAAWQEEV